ncbi:transporter substrate-binding domain-containing protein [Endozoicomonas sp. SM1973]|uniref:Transporter substrate-binding domain-containing protein n=1 Tax=Spartinivicinus marinus TaxID=2994442 RepID=A0A853HUM2_9GAMM|nr:transporter substrate-binding domain-containing protein [Spartinivicinus marinus]MCX4029388.1 transporter substrate-binding domain-containing protein [Spartinivicinus marinus]NYZ64963.1 transporter substrate-binding domain-containing protein [Spartinivicinus marinus]
MAYVWFKRIFTTICLSGITVVQASPIVTIAYEDTAQVPYYLGVGSIVPKQRPGITVELLNHIAKRLNFKINYVRYPWSRCLATLGDNRVDAIFHASFKQDRMKLGVYPMSRDLPDSLKRVHRKAYALYTINGFDLKWDGKQFVNLKGLIGVTHKYAIANQLESMGVKIDKAYDSLTHLRKLVARRIVGIVDLENKMDPILSENKSQFSQVVKVLPLVSTKDYYLIFSHKFYQTNKKLAAAIWDEIHIAHKTGVYSDIAKKY